MYVHRQDVVTRFLDYLLILLNQFVGGPGEPENNLVRFGLAAAFLAVLLWVAWVRQRRYDLPRERRLVWGFGLALARELLMFVFTSLQILGLVEQGAAYSMFAPLECALAVAAIVTIAGAFLRYILDDDRLSRRYLQIGLGGTGALYLVSASWWAFYVQSQPATSFRQTWASWLFRGLVSVLLLYAILQVARKRGWLRNTMLVAFSLFFLDELFSVCSVVGAEHNRILCPISHAFHLAGIGLLGYVYLREQAAERRRAEEELIALNAIATTISQELDLARMLNAILQKVLQVVGAEAGCMRLVDRVSQSLALAAHCLQPQESAQGTHLRASEAESAEQAYRTERPVISIWREATGVMHERTDAPGSSYAITCVPVRSRDTVVGVLSVLVPGERRPDEHKVALLTSIGHQIGVAVENTWLADEVSKAEIGKELNRLRSELIANVSHEMRTPLGLIKGACTSLLATDVEFPPEIVREFLASIDQETDRMERIVGNLLDLSQIESGRLRLNKQPVDVQKLVRETVRSIQAQAPDREIGTVLPESLAIDVDRGRIEQVLRNLLSNAIKYSPDGGTVEVRVYPDQGQVYFLVSDKGIGISKQDQERVFERFYRVENAVTLSQPGVGLGLAVCRHIVEAHGGRIWVESELDQGSTFYVALPIVPAGTVVPRSVRSTVAPEQVG